MGIGGHVSDGELTPNCAPGNWRTTDRYRDSDFGEVRMTPDLARCAHGIERARDQLRGTRAVGGVGGLGLQQLGVGQNNAQLIVQPVEQHTQVW